MRLRVLNALENLICLLTFGVFSAFGSSKALNVFKNLIRLIII